MSPAEAVALIAAGFGGGLLGSTAGLASLVSYPALLAIGLPPVTANVTNTVALICSSTGSVTGSRPELVGQGRRIRQLAIAATVGGAAGAALLLATPADSFERVVPWLIGLASIAILVRRKRTGSQHPGSQHPGSGSAGAPHHAGPTMVAAVGVVGVYGGYFGAGAGVMLLALLLFATGEPIAKCNAVKNVVLGIANGTAAAGFAIFGPVRWSVVLPLGIGLFIGGRTGPVVVRRLPPTLLRYGIAAAGIGVAIKLGIDAYS